MSNVEVGRFLEWWTVATKHATINGFSVPQLKGGLSGGGDGGVLSFMLL